MSNKWSRLYGDPGELAALRVSLGSMFEGSGDVMLVVDRDLRVAGFNEAAAAALGLVQGHVGARLAGIAGLAAVVGSVRHSIQKQRRIEGRPMDLGVCRVLPRVLPLHEPGEEVGAALLVLLDITKAVEFEQRFEFAIRAAFMSWWEWDLVADRVDVHRGDYNMLGFELEALPRSRKDWMRLVHPDDQQYVAQNLEDCLAGHTDLWFCECRLRTADGGWIWVDIRGKVKRRDADGRPVLMMGSTQDIDASKRAHLDMRSKNDMLETAGEIIKMGTWEYYPDAGKITWSKQTRRILGVDDKFPATADAFFECLHPEDAELIKAAFAKTLEDGTPYNLKLRCTNKQGKQLIVRSACKARYDLFGKLVRVTGIFQDITGE